MKLAPGLIGGLCLLCLAQAGCSRGGPALGRVSGTVTLDGQPLPLATLEFQPQAPGSAPSYATTNAQGHYTLAYSAKRPGATLGSHTVRITTYRVEEREGGPRQVIPERLPVRYHERTELTREVHSGKNVFDFALVSQ